MADRDPLLPNAGIVARREYRDRTRSRLYIGSTIVLALLATLVAIAPIAVRYLDRQTVTRIAVVAADVDLATRTVSMADSLLNVAPPGADAATWKKPFAVQVADDAAAAEHDLNSGTVVGVMLVQRLANGQVDVVLRTTEGPNSPRSQILSVAAFGIGVLDWSARLPPDASRPEFHPPSYQVQSLNIATDAGVALDARQAASRHLLGLVFVILLLISIVIYGMWVATGVAAEKSSRVMELMISAASPAQMLTGKVVGIGAAGLTQYIAIADPGTAAARPPGPDRDGRARAGLGGRGAAGWSDTSAAAGLRRSSSCWGSCCSPSSMPRWARSSAGPMTSRRCPCR